mmetsp:Transcript_133212/g.198159  ORF Transcript_133212/g.198159 Transcript_133212/m.198159 type:complete len:124 (+) Transcript_133212:46-417(+)
MAGFARRALVSAACRPFHSTAATAYDIPTQPKALYKSLIRAVQAFPDEAMSVVNKDQRPFTEIGVEKVRTEFKQNAAVDAPTATKLISSAGKELKAIYSMLENDNLNQFPGPPVVKTLYEGQE